MFRARLFSVKQGRTGGYSGEGHQGGHKAEKHDVHGEAEKSGFSLKRRQRMSSDT